MSLALIYICQLLRFNLPPLANLFPPPLIHLLLQSYVVNKLMRYLRWSNLVRKHFQSSDQESSRRRDAGNNNSDAETRENGRPPPMMDRTEIFHDSDSVAGNGPTRACVGIDGDGGGGVVTMNAGGDSGRPRRRRSDIGSSSTVAYGHASGVNGGDGGGCRHVEGAVSNGFVVSPHRNGCDGGGSGSGDGGGGGGQGDEGLSERYTFSDRGECARRGRVGRQRERDWERERAIYG